jgi:hypothetical protein
MAIKALVWRNPYAALMLHGKIETRTRPVAYRGDVLICTAKQLPPQGWVHLVSGTHQAERISEVLKAVKGNYNFCSEIEPTANLHGYAIAVGTIVGCRRMLPEDEDATFVQYDSGRWCWIFENVRRIEPFVWTHGKQGWLDVPLFEEEKIVYV